MNNRRSGDISAALMGAPQVAQALAQLAARVGETTIVLDSIGQCVQGSDEAQRVWTELRGTMIVDARAWSSVSDRPLLLSAWGVELG